MTVVHQHHHRGPWQPGPKDPPAPTCPGCGGTLEAGALEDGRLLGVCYNPTCAEFVLFRPAEAPGRWIVSERIPPARRRTGPTDRPGAIGPAAG